VGAAPNPSSTDDLAATTDPSIQTGGIRPTQLVVGVLPGTSPLTGSAFGLLCPPSHPSRWQLALIAIVSARRHQRRLSANSVADCRADVTPKDQLGTKTALHEIKSVGPRCDSAFRT
jgi:hypothetical protein